MVLVLGLIFVLDLLLSWSGFFLDPGLVLVLVLILFWSGVRFKSNSRTVNGWGRVGLGKFQNI